jgi:hypothetical protein
MDRKRKKTTKKYQVFHDLKKGGFGYCDFIKILVKFKAKKPFQINGKVFLQINSKLF